MNIGEMFVALGVKGSEKTLAGLGAVRKGMNDLFSTSLETKAGIIGAMYAAERLFAKSGATGTGLTNFTALTGKSAIELQRWQYAARQAGVANEEFTGSFKSVQGAMTNMLMGKGAPEGLALVASKVGFDAKRARDTFYVMEQLQKFAKSAPADVGNAVLKSFGLGEGTVAAMRRGAFNAQAFAAAPTYSQKEVGQLDKANIAWSNLGNQIEMAVGRFNASHGGQLVQDISKLVPKVLTLVEAFTKLADKLKIFQGIGKVFEGWSLIFDKVSSGVDSITGAIGDEGKRKTLGDDTLQFFKEMPGVFKVMAEDLLPGSKAVASGSPAVVGPPTNVAGGAQNNIVVHQNLTFQHDGKDPKKTEESVKRANQDAFRQFNQGQVN